MTSTDVFIKEKLISLLRIIKEKTFKLYLSFSSNSSAKFTKLRIFGFVRIQKALNLMEIKMGKF